MSETNMPAAETNSADERDFTSYEFAFHILPTVAEGEVPSVVDALKAHITKAGGEITDEETAKRFDLAYEITKYLEGKHRKFNSAYFGWVRFRLNAGSLVELTETLDGSKEVLRYLLVKLTKVEEQNPFKFHESIVGRQVRTISDEEMAEVEAEAAALALPEILDEEMAEVEAEAAALALPEILDEEVAVVEADDKEVEETV